MDFDKEHGKKLFNTNMKIGTNTNLSTQISKKLFDMDLEISFSTHKENMLSNKNIETCFLTRADN